MTHEGSDIQGIVRMTKDLQGAATRLKQREARFLVDTYYQQQDERIRAAQRAEAAAKGGEPNELLKWDAENSRRRESDLKLVLGHFARQWRVGRWMQSICGIGPVISAGLLAHIDVRRAPTASCIWGLAGLNPAMEWISKENAKKYAAEIMDGSKKVTPEAVEAAAKLTGRHPEAMQRIIKKKTADGLASAIAMRPWSTPFKTLCAFKAGECFVKVQNNDKDFYGSIYRERKDMETEINERGGFSEQAALALAKKKYRTSTDAFKHYTEGRLPPAHVHARARRYAVKIFLAHVHQVMFEDYHQRPAPLPYAFAHLPEQHKYWKPAPNWPAEHAGRPITELLEAS